MFCNCLFHRVARPWPAALFAAFLLLPLLGLVSFNPSPVEAVTGTFDVTPTSGPPGTRVSINGSGFGNNTSLTIKFGSDNRTVSSFGRSGARGDIQGRVYIPDLPGGSITITIAGSNTVTTGNTDEGTQIPRQEQYTGSAGFRVEPKAEISSTTGPVGHSVTVSGRGFHAGERPSVKFDGKVVANPNPRDNGKLPSVAFQVPAVPAGDYEITVGDVDAGTFTVTSQFTVIPQRGPPGTTIQVSGTGYMSGGTVTMMIDNEHLDPLRADQHGVLTGSVQIPVLSGGRKIITATATAAGSVQATFEVTPTLVIEPENATPGALVHVSGTAFRANETGIQVKFNTTTVASGIAADDKGVWSADFTVPATTSGRHNVTATGSSTKSRVPTRRLTVGSGIRLETPSGPPGTLIVIHGSGVRANESMAIDVGGGLAVAETTAGASGTWRLEIPAPAAPRGPLTISAKGVTGEANTVVFNITSRIEISASQGQPGSTVTVTGDGFTANKAGIPILFYSEIVASANADSQGSFTANITIPAVPRGSYPVRVSGSSADLQATYSVSAALSVNVQEAATGDPVTVSGDGFAANETGIVIKLGETTAAQGIAANASGSWTNTFHLPPLPANTYNLTVAGTQTGNGQVPVLALKTLSRAIVTPASGIIGSTATVTGQGFSASDQTITLAYDGVTVVTGIAADPTGGFSVSFQVPLSAGGDHVVEVFGANQVTSTRAGFEVIPSVALGEDTGIAADPVTLLGYGFGANENNIQLSFGSVLVDDGVTADASGHFEAEFQIPSAPAGKYAVNAVGSTGNAAVPAPDSFEVKSNISLSESAGHVGMTLQLQGTGFSPQSNIAVAFGTLIQETILSDETGGFIWQVTAPMSAGGEHPISAQDNRGNRLQVPFALETDPPAAPALRSPDNGSRSGFFGGFQPVTRWTPVEDPSGVTYNLQVADDAEFFDPIVEQKGLANPTYPFTETQALERGTYYWRVQAVDQAGNEGPYSPVFEMNSGLVPVWLFSVIVLFGLLASSGGAYAVYTKVSRARRVVQEPTAFPEFVRISRPEIAGPAQTPGQPTSSTPALSAPQSPPPQAQSAPPQQPHAYPPPQSFPPQPGAQPSPPRGRQSTPPQRPNPFRRGGGPPTGGVSPEQQARVQLVVDFVRSIPLLNVGTDLRWLEEVIEPFGGPDPGVYSRVLQGDLEPVYQPAWLQHPTYQQLQGEPSATPFVDGLETYIEAVNDCGAFTLIVLRRISQDLGSTGPSDAMALYEWPFVLSVGQSVVAWFRGTYLAQPSARDYLLQPMADGSSLAALYGAANAPFAGLIAEGMPEEDLLFVRDLHIQLRNTYRADDDARAVAAKLTSIESLREQIQRNIGQMGG